MTVFQAGGIAGPLVGGALIPLIGFSWLYLIDTVTLFATLGAVVGLPRLPVEGAIGTPGLRSVIDGFRYLPDPAGAADVVRRRHHRDGLRHAAGAVPGDGAHRLRRPDEGGLAFALLFAAIPPGAVIGGVFSGWVSRVERQGLAVIVAIIVWGLAMTGFGVAAMLAPCAPRLMLGVAVVMLAIGGAADMASSAFRTRCCRPPPPTPCAAGCRASSSSSSRAAPGSPTSRTARPPRHGSRRRRGRWRRARRGRHGRRGARRTGVRALPAAAVCGLARELRRIQPSVHRRRGQHPPAPVGRGSIRTACVPFPQQHRRHGSGRPGVGRRRTCPRHRHAEAAKRPSFGHVPECTSTRPASGRQTTRALDECSAVFPGSRTTTEPRASRCASSRRRRASRRRP